MSTSEKLSPFAAILISLNIMIGSGLFINTVLLAQDSGPLSPFIYILVGLLTFPLIKSFSQLVAYHPGGGFYEYAQEINPYFGFLSLWSYSITKMSGATFGIHIFNSLMQTIFPSLQQFNTIHLDLGIITLFIALNMLNMKTGKKIQFSFLILKIIPILFAIIAGIILFDFNNFSVPVSYKPILTSLPFALFGLTGFEAICSLSKKIQNPEKNGSLIIFSSFFISVAVIFFYQLMFFGSLGAKLYNLSSYLEAFPTLLAQFPLNTKLSALLETIIHIGVGGSALGVAYGIMYSNSWNIYTLAKKKLIFFSCQFTQLNKHHVPWVAILAEGIIAYIFILLTQGYQVAFQQITIIGLTTTYTLSCVGLLVGSFRKNNTINLTALCGILSCVILILSQMQSFLTYGIKYPLIYLTLMLCGTIMYFLKQNQLANLECQKRNQA